MTPTPTAQFCQTCSSQSITPASNPYIPPCCGVPICAACLARNPRLREYVPCLRCGDVRSAAGSLAVARGRAEREKRRVEEEKGRFVLGDSDEEGGEDDDDDDDDDEGDDGGGDGGGGHRSGNGNGNDDDAKGRESTGADSATAEDHVEVEVTHTLARGDTLLSVARKYAADPHDLLALNSLPHAALHTNPSLLRTRRTLVVARRRVPASQAGAEVRPGEDGSDAGKKARRALRRFQRVSREDGSVGRVYLALNDDGDGNNDGGGGAHNSGPIDACNELDLNHRSTAVDMEAGGERRPAGDTSGEKKHPRTADPAARALAHYFDDEEWAAGAAAPARGTSTSGKWRVVAPVLPEGVKEEGSGGGGGGYGGGKG